MEYLVKRKKFVLLEDISETKHIVTFKNKKYILRQFGDDKNAFLDYVDQKKLLQMSGVKNPKVIRVDKKSRMVVEQLIEGECIFDMLRNNYGLNDRIYELIFEMNFRAKMERLNLNFNPKNFIYTEDDFLYYMSSEFSKYEEEKSFVKKDIKIWFYTKEFVELLKNENLPYDINKLKQGYDINKEMVLKTVQYYK